MTKVDKKCTKNCYKTIRKKYLKMRQKDASIPLIAGNIEFAKSDKKCVKKYIKSGKKSQNCRNTIYKNKNFYFVDMRRL